MININGVREIINIYDYLDQKLPKFDFTAGVLQSIGYKEFHEFYQLYKKLHKPPLPETLSQYKVVEDMSPELQDNLVQCADNLVIATKNYAAKQILWIKTRLHDQALTKDNVFLLEFTDAKKFGEEVVERGKQIAQNYLDGKLQFREPQLNEAGLFEGDFEKYEHEWKKIRCEICNVELNGESEYEGHISSKRHKKMIEKKKKYEKNMEMKLKYQQLKQQEEKDGSNGGEHEAEAQGDENEE